MNYFLIAGFSLLLFSTTSCSKRPPSLESEITFDKSAGISGYQLWNEMGFHEGEQSPNFTLFSGRGQKFNLYETLQKDNKPVMLITGSYTCDVTRHNLKAINELSDSIGNKVDMYMIYTIDAHPADVPSPYSANDKPWIAKANIRDSVEEAQPATYGERIQLADKWKNDYDVKPPILIDTPENGFWKNFGQAPNMVYLILPSGIIYFKQSWFNEKEVKESVKSLLSQDKRTSLNEDLLLME